MPVSQGLNLDTSLKAGALNKEVLLASQRLLMEVGLESSASTACEDVLVISHTSENRE